MSAARNVARAAGSALVLLVLLVGVPVALWALRGSPLPSEVPTLSDATNLFTSPDRDGSVFLGFLTVIGWVAWVTFAVSVVLEAVGGLRSRSLPSIPGLGVQRRLAAALLAAIFFSGSIGTLGEVGQATALTPGGAPTVAAALSSSQPDATPVEAATDTPGVAVTTQSEPDEAERYRDYAVREGDTLWGIAEHVLGDGHRWQEIADANYDRTQPDGRQLDRQHWLQPGWVLAVPVQEIADQTDADESRETAGKHVVQPGDTLSAIAADELGQAQQWPAIADANPDVEDPDLIYPGEVLTIPGDETATQPAADVEPAPEPEPEAEVNLGAQLGTASASGVTEVALDADLGAQFAAAAPAGLTPPETAAEPALAEAGSTSEVDEDQALPMATLGGIGGILAAGLLAHLVWRRRAQNSVRRPGQTIPPLPVAVAAAEQQLRDVADPLGRDQVDVALRGIAQHCAHTQTPLPLVQSARLTATAFELYLTEPAALPEPWVGTPENTVWALHVEDIDEMPTLEAGILAPYPALTVVGQDSEDAHILLDLEQIGALTLSGDTSAAGQIITAVAIELAVSHWADDLGITLVGVGRELAEVLDTGRVTYVETAHELLIRLARRADHDREVLTRANADTASQARARQDDDLWAPEIVLIADPLTSDQQAQLDSVIHDLPKVAVAAVTTGESSVTEWSLRVDGPHDALLSPAGLSISPQRADDDTYRAAVEMLRATYSPPVGNLMGYPAEVTVAEVVEQHNHLEVSPEPAPIPVPRPDTETVVDEETTGDGPTDEVADDVDIGAPTEQAAAEPVEDEQTGPEHPRLKLLGEVHLAGATGPLQASHLGTITEIAAYIATHPGTTGAQIQENVWPGEPARVSTRQQAVSRLHRWLGGDTEGVPYLPNVTAGGGYRFIDAVTTDWDEFETLTGEGLANTSTADLTAALSLVGGDPFTWTKRSRRPKYRWAHELRTRMRQEITDAAAELARRSLRAGDGATAVWATGVGLDLEPGMQSLWRSHLKGHYLAGDIHTLHQRASKLYATLEELGVDPTEDTVREVDVLLERPQDAGERTPAWA